MSKQTYKGNGNHAWEPVANDASCVTTRLRVPGGWLYHSRNKMYGFTSQSFVPLPANLSADKGGEGGFYL